MDASLQNFQIATIQKWNEILLMNSIKKIFSICVNEIFWLCLFQTVSTRWSSTASRMSRRRRTAVSRSSTTTATSQRRPPRSASVLAVSACSTATSSLTGLTHRSSQMRRQCRRRVWTRIPLLTSTCHAQYRATCHNFKVRVVMFWLLLKNPKPSFFLEKPKKNDTEVFSCH